MYDLKSDKTEEVNDIYVVLVIIMMMMIEQ